MENLLLSQAAILVKGYAPCIHCFHLFWWKGLYSWNGVILFLAALCYVPQTLFLVFSNSAFFSSVSLVWSRETMRQMDCGTSILFKSTSSDMAMQEQEMLEFPLVWGSLTFHPLWWHHSSFTLIELKNRKIIIFSHDNFLLALSVSTSLKPWPQVTH